MLNKIENIQSEIIMYTLEQLVPKESGIKIDFGHESVEMLE